MAQSYNSPNGTLIIPGAYAEYSVKGNVGGLAVNGVVVLVGEAAAGPHWSEETSLEANAFTPSQLGAVVAKYSSGPLVEAFAMAIVPMNDPQIVGAPTRIILVKTNASTKATGELVKFNASEYAEISAKTAGIAANSIGYSVTAAESEVVPTTSSVTFIPSVGAITAAIRANGGAELPLSLSANITPTAFVAAVAGLSGINATGGVDRAILTVSGTLALDANPGGAGANVVAVTRSVAWAATPSVGDTVVIPTGSILAGGSDQNVGAYVVTAVTSTLVTATKLSDAGKSGAVVGVVTAPADVAAASVAATTDFRAFSPAVISLDAGDPVSGAGKSMEIIEKSGADLLSNTLYDLDTDKVTFVSKTGAPKIIVSAAEYVASLNTSKASDGFSESISAGGDIAMELGYVGTTCTLTITSTTLSTTVAGGSGSSLSIALSNFPSIQDLADFISTQTGYTATCPDAALALLPCSALDQVSALGICSTWGENAGRVKTDGYKFAKAIEENSTVVSMVATSGLPAPASLKFLSGGARGGTTAAAFLAAVNALDKVRCNFVVPLVSRNATADIIDGYTDPSSTYTIDGVHLAVKNHCIKMSAYKKQRNRQCFLAIDDTFKNQIKAASKIGKIGSMSIMNHKLLALNGQVQQFLSWSDATLAAAAQAAAFYKPVYNKIINSSGVVHLEGDFDPYDDGQVEQGLLGGLLIARENESGGIRWVSDQNCWIQDSNAIYNSFQAIYVADVISMSTARTMSNQFIGQSTADITASAVEASFYGFMAQLLRLKLLAASPQAPLGHTRPIITISGPVVTIEASVVLSTGIYFIPIKFSIDTVQSSN